MQWLEHMRITPKAYRKRQTTNKEIWLRVNTIIAAGQEVQVSALLPGDLLC
jgi:hypothetical protein